MRYPDEIIEEVREKNDIVDVIGEYVKLKRAGTNYTGLCPFHNEKTPSFSVSADKQLYYCFGCHAGGNVFTFIREYQNATFSEALQILADRAGIALPERDRTREEKERDNERNLQYAILKAAASFYHYKLKTKSGLPGLDYLKKRGLGDDTIQSFGLGFSGKYNNELYKYLKSKGYNDKALLESGLFSFSETRGFTDKFWNRVMFPICDLRGRVIGFGGRVMGDAKPKYLNSPETKLFNKRMNLFAMNIARSSTKDQVILCEGYMDVITMHQAGFKNAVASLGTAFTEEQALLLKRFTKELVLMYDSDAAGVSAALRAIEICDNSGISVRVADLSPYKDPDEFIKAEGAKKMEERLSKAKDGFTFTVVQMSRNTDFSDPKSKTMFEHDVARKLVTVEDELLRNNLLESLCVMFKIPRDSMKRTVAEYAQLGISQRKYKNTRAAGNSKEKDDRKTERLMLYYLANYSEAYGQIKNLITPRDFSDGFMRQAADKIFDKINRGEMNLSSIVDEFEDLEDQKKITSIMTRKLPVASNEELDKAFTDIVLRFLKDKNERTMESGANDSEALTGYMKTKAKLEEFERSGKKFHLPYKE